MTADPFKDNAQKDDRRTRIEGLEIAQVVRVPDSNNHTVIVRAASVQGQATSSTPEAASVTAATSGDVSIPSEGDLVLVGRTIGGTAIVIGTVYSDTADVPTYDTGDRIVGNDDGPVILGGDFAVAPRFDSDPDDPSDGAIWYRNDLDEYRGVEDGTTVTFNTTAA